jgi:hypothetical protein
MGELCEVNDNLKILKSFQKRIESAGSDSISIEIQGIKIGDFVLITCPGEMFAEIGLNIKEKSPYEFTFVSGNSNGNNYYLPTADAFKGWAYEDFYCFVAPEWQKIFEKKALEIIKRL